jgi:hypothetical protein
LKRVSQRELSAAPGKTDDQLRTIDQAQNERPVAVDRQ